MLDNLKNNEKMSKKDKFAQTNHRSMTGEEWLNKVKEMEPGEHPGKWPISKWLKFAEELSEINIEKQIDFDAKNCSRIFEVVLKSENN